VLIAAVFALAIFMDVVLVVGSLSIIDAGRASRIRRCHRCHCDAVCLSTRGREPTRLRMAEEFIVLPLLQLLLHMPGGPLSMKNTP
jgi:hypothetical protein